MMSGSPDGAKSSARLSERAPYVIASVIFLCAVGATIYFTESMSGGMPMPGNWTMSMMWMPMGGRLGSAVTFTVMWLAMMIAMILPSTMPMLLLYRRASAFRGENRIGLAVFALGTGYFFVWTLFGIVAYQSLYSWLAVRCT